ncbi:ABC transporter permease [Roseateles sp. DB2]|uniref:ABC transporter permease n=1 Tax=Roseateles sp. DB2 TaxID=3453717 RepID=UPI003EEE366D
MKYLFLLWAGLTRSRSRTSLTVVSVAIAFMLFGLLDSVRAAFDASSSLSGHNRLIVASRTSILHHLPAALGDRIRKIPEVSAVAHSTLFNGIYQDVQNFFPSVAVDPGLLGQYPEYEISRKQLEDFAKLRDGAIVGESLARQYGWKIGDKIPMQAAEYPAQGSADWSFTLVGTFAVKERSRAAEEKQMMIRWDYFEQANDYLKGVVGWYTITLREGADAGKVSAAIDAMTANSDHATRTQTEQAFSQSLLKQIADIGLIVTSILSAVFFALILLVANTMAQAVRERTSEIATLKAIGFRDGLVMLLIMAESLAILLLGGGIGMALATVVTPLLGEASGGAVSIAEIPVRTWLSAAGIVLMVGLLVGFVPGRQAMRINIVTALSRR